MKTIYQKVTIDRKRLNTEFNGQIPDKNNIVTIENKEGFVNYITALVKALVLNDQLKINNYLREFVMSQIDKWVHSCIHALYGLIKNRDYIVRDKKIKIVDLNTGVI